MKKLNFIAGILALATIIIGLYFLKKEFLEPSPTTITSTGPTIEELQNMADLVSSRINISDILEGENNHFKGSWIIKGDALISTDLSKAEFRDINTTNRTATILLPEPRVISARVDHEKTSTHNVTKKKWIVNKNNESRLRDTAMRQAQKLIHKSASKPHRIEEAKQQTLTVIQSFYKEIDWDVKIRWQNSAQP